VAFLRNKKIVISSVLLICLMVISLLSVWLIEPHVKPILSIKDKNGVPIASMPLSPKYVKPFGTDQLGFPLLFLLIKGAKFTIGIAIIVSFLRLIFGLLFGVGVTLLPKWLRDGLTQMLTPFNYLPVSLFSYILLVNVLLGTSGYRTLSGHMDMNMVHGMVFELFLLTLVGIPTLLIYFKEVTEQYLKEDHIAAARVLGAGKYRIL
jgi:peptide/nickel transport system permease protein